MGNLNNIGMGSYSTSVFIEKESERNVNYIHQMENCIKNLNKGPCITRLLQPIKEPPLWRFFYWIEGVWVRPNE